ncbi:FAD-dependent oxidoreductase [Hyphomonas sp.]|jgi:choline dehydrogenase-like flavoprotein|uniref:FAD-dependent oxidoreductase n=1 Tax=Hyphomonas sp. TaxID=87 RepID=UPI0039E5CAC7
MAKTQSSSDGFDKRDLRTGSPVWLAARKTPRHTTYDVVIVGSGISGALTAWHVCNGKRRVLLIDRRPPVTGSTPAMIQYEIGAPLHRLANMIGETRARRAWQRAAQAVTRLGERSSGTKTLPVAMRPSQPSTSREANSVSARCRTSKRDVRPPVSRHACSRHGSFAKHMAWTAREPCLANRQRPLIRRS